MTTDKKTLWIQDHTAHVSTSSHAVIEAHMSGSLGKAASETEDAKAFGKSETSSVYGERFQSAMIADTTIAVLWKNIPYQNGAYPYFAVGQRKYLSELRKSAGKIVFAGEYTSVTHPASIEGALESGYRAANESNKLSCSDESVARLFVK